MSVGSLNIALSGLRMAQQQVNLVSQNIANATTPGYTRKILPQQNYVADGVSLGVRGLEIRRNVNIYLQQDFYNQTSLSSASDAQRPYFNQIQAFHGDPNDQRSIANALQRLQDDFLALSDQPDSAVLLNNTLAHAVSFAGKVNDLSTLYTKLRNDAQMEMEDSLNKVRVLLKTIADTNAQIVSGLNIGRSVADVEDQRDIALKELSKEMDISYYTLGDGTIAVQTQKSGHTLVDYTVRDLSFSPATLGVVSTYPSSAAGIYIDNPTTTQTTQDTDITNDELGGRLGALVTLRDATLPRYQAELDEMAQKLSQRFDEQGLRLFTDETGTIPPNVAPPANTNYTGYSTAMQVNQRILDDPNLLRLGTSGEVIPNGSARIIERVVEYTFGATRGESALGNVDLDATGTATLFATLGLDTQAKLTGLKNIQALATLDADGHIVPTVNDTFTIAIGANPPVDILINAGDTAVDLVNAINAALGAPVASLNAVGRLVLQSDESIQIGAGTLLPAAFETLGISPGLTPAKNPSFTVQLEDGLLNTIEILPTDTSVQLLNKLNMVSGLNASLDASGYLSLSTDYGAKIKLVDTQGEPVADMGLRISAVQHEAFRVSNLGPSGDLTSAINATDKIVDYAQRAVAIQATDASAVEQQYSDAETYRATLEAQILNDSGVNLDEEMANLIAMQRVYGANAKMITTSIEMLEELTNAF